MSVTFSVQRFFALKLSLAILEEIVKIQTDLISENDYQKLRNKFDNTFVSTKSTIEGIANNLATYYLLYKNVNLINTEIELSNYLLCSKVIF